MIKESFSYVRSSPKQGIYQDPLPKRKIKKSALSGRVEIGAEKRQTAITLNIKDTPKNQACIEEELAPEDGPLYDSDFQHFTDLTRPDEEKEEKKSNSDLIKASPIEKQKNLTEKDNQNEVLETNFVPPSGKPKLHRKLIFSIQEKCNILQGKMLSDESINLAKKLLAEQFPGISGLMDTCLGKLHQFGIIPVDKSYIQLLHVGSMHWVCISNMETNKYDNGTHYVYDSLCKPKIMLDIVKQVASYSYHDKSTMSLLTRSVQQQKNGVDCELVSIAFAATLAFGADPSTVNYDAALLRAHLIKCFDNKLMVEFPVTEKCVIKCKPYTSIVELYCVCRMPYWRTDEIGLRMAECKSCERWFHCNCEKIPAAAFSAGKKWFCLNGR